MIENLKKIIDKAIKTGIGEGYMRNGEYQYRYETFDPEIALENVMEALDKNFEVTAKIAKRGDVIQWSFPEDHGTYLAGRTFKAKVEVVLKREECYGVYAEYGQDKIPFNQCEILEGES